jgi:WD40 repeat protein/transcriptional regulator with XRE-family HTH domain
MKRFSYRERDYSFGQTMLGLRTALELTQAGLAEQLGVSRRAVGRWEGGGDYPKVKHLKQLIVLAVTHQVWPAESADEKIRELWQAAHQKAPLDERWLATLLHDPASLAPAPRPADERGMQPREPLLPPPSSVRREDGPGQVRVDWGEALTAPTFYGRAEELATLRCWLVEERCRVVSVLGMGGIGKSALVVSAIHHVAPHFEVVIFRSLRNAPSCAALLDDCLHVLEPHPLDAALPSLEARISRLLEHLRQRRVLLVLDNVETILAAGDLHGHLRAGLEEYNLLLQRVGETAHASCLLLTSREQLAVLRALEGSHGPVRALRLAGLDAAAGAQLLAAHELVGSVAEQTRLVEAYGGNPLALQIVAHTIVELFGGVIGSFLAQGAVVFGSIAEQIGEQVARLSALEQTILYWLAVVREPVTLAELQSVLAPPPLPRLLLEAVDSLRRHCLVERGPRPGSFTLQTVVLEYITDEFVTQAANEIQQGRLVRLLEHRLRQAQAKDYVQHTQERLIVTPILTRLRTAYRGQAAAEERLLALFDPLRGEADDIQGYGPANLLTLLRASRGHLSGVDLSRLSLRAANLQGITMQDTSLVQASLHDCTFTETFGLIWTLTISPQGTYWAAGDRQGQVRVWRNAGQTLHLAWQAHSYTIATLAISPDERCLATTSWEGGLTVWDLAGGVAIWTIPFLDAWALDFAPDGRTLVSGGLDGQIHLWDVATGTKLQTLVEHSGPVYRLAWSPDGRLLASAGFDAQIRLWANAGEPSGTLQLTLTRQLSGHTSLVTGLAFAPDGQTLASASWDLTVKLWAIHAGRLIETLPVQARHSNLAWSPDGRLLAAAAIDPAFWVWDLEQRSRRTEFNGQTTAVHDLAFTPDSRSLVTTHDDGALRVWDVATSRCIRTTECFAVAVSDIAWSPDGAQIASGSSNLMVTIWDITSSIPLKLVNSHQLYIWGVTWSPDGRLIASCGEEGAVHIWDAATGASVGVLQDPTQERAIYFSLAWSPDGRRLAVGSYAQGVLIWDRITQTVRRIGPTDLPVWMRAIQWSPDGGCLAAPGPVGAVYVWDTEAWALRATLSGHRGRVTSMAWSPDGAQLATGSAGQGRDQLFIWEVASGQRLRVLDDPNQVVYGVAWGADGERLVSAGNDGALRWWETQSGRCIMARQGHDGPVAALRTSPGGRLLASCGADGAIQLWEFASGKHLQTLRRDRPYERLNITGVKGLTEAQKLTLRMMGAFDATTRVGVNGHRLPEMETIDPAR